jgi:hypothetical protein
MIVVKINAGDHVIVLTPGNSIYTSGSFGKLGSGLLFTSAGIPSENGWLRANLSGCSHLLLVAKLDAHDIVGVSIHIVGGLL